MCFMTDDSLARSFFIQTQSQLIHQRNYLVSGTTFRNYIVPNLKQQFFFYINLLLDLFCRAG